MYSPFTSKIRSKVTPIVIGSFIALLSLGPLYWLLLTSLKPMGTEFLKPITYWPKEWNFDNYQRILGADFEFQRAIFNSLVLSTTVMVVSILLSGMSAYAISRIRFKHGRKSLFLILMAGLVPPVATIAPTFILMRSMGLLGTLPGLILPNIAYNIPISTWLLCAYFMHLPEDLEDSAKMDGYAPCQVFWKVILPLAKPGLFATGAFAFLGAWGEFMVSFSISLGKAEAQTVPVAISRYESSF